MGLFLFCLFSFALVIVVLSLLGRANAKNDEYMRLSDERARADLDRRLKRIRAEKLESFEKMLLSK
jgi:hypothetical protein